MKCRDALEPETIRKCRGPCDGADGRDGNDDGGGGGGVGVSVGGVAEPEINNEIIDLLVPAVEPKKSPKSAAGGEGPEAPASGESQRRPDVHVEDKVAADRIQVVEMQPLDDSNDIALSDAPTSATASKKMSVHVGEDAVLFLDRLAAARHPADTIDVAKIKPTFKWKIGQWTRVRLTHNFDDFQARGHVLVDLTLIG